MNIRSRSVTFVIELTAHNEIVRYTDGLTLSQLMSHICGVSKKFGEWYQKTNKTEDSFQKLYERCQPCVVKDGDYFEVQQI
jgi:hypothetical protein